MKLVALGEVSKIVTGSTPTTSDPLNFGGPVPFVTPSDLGDSKPITTAARSLTAQGAASSRLVSPGSVLICCIGSIGKIGIAGTELATNQQINAVIFDRTLVDSRYGFFACTRIAPQLLKMTSSTTVPIVSKSRLTEARIPLPPLDEQRRIAAILDKADELRTKRRQALAHLDALTQSIFHTMFGSGVPSQSVHPIVKIRDVLESAKYGTGEKATTSGDVPVLRMGNLTYGGRLDLADLKYVVGGQPEKYLLRNGDVLFNRTNSPDLVGKTAVFRGSDIVAYAGYLVRLRTSREIDPEYLVTFMNLPSTKQLLRNMCKSIVGMANINAQEVQSIRLPLPPLELQQTFASRVAAVERLKESHRKHLAELDTLFASLQHRAFRGEL